MKKIGYLIFACFYYLFRITKRKDNKVFCIMTHDSSRDSNVGMIVQYLKKHNSEKYQFRYFKKDQKNAISGKSGLVKVLQNLIDFFIVKPYHIATSEVILQDNVFLPFAYIHFPKRVKVIQLWHGTGSIKKFGQDANTGSLKTLEFKANQTITHLIVNTEAMREQYSRAFGVPISSVYSLGLPRTDLLFQQKKMQREKEQFFGEYPELSGKKIILYAPTFRDSEVENPKMELNARLLLDGISEDFILILKLHPHVASKYQQSDQEIELIKHHRLYDLSSYWDTNTLLSVSDLLITDYSSIIFEYCLEEKPMIFYAYDLEDFSNNGRGFYIEYAKDMPGPIASNTEQIIDIINADSYDFNVIKFFKDQYYDYFDGRSSQRIVEKIIY